MSSNPFIDLKDKKMTVDAVSLWRLLSAVMGPAHEINEMRVIFNLHQKTKETDDPLTILVTQVQEQYHTCGDMTTVNKREVLDVFGGLVTIIDGFISDPTLRPFIDRDPKAKVTLDVFSKLKDAIAKGEIGI